MKILITGGAGFIGSHLTDYIHIFGHDITILDNFSTGKKDNISSLDNINIVEGDICDHDLVDKLTVDTDIIFHLAASVCVQKSIQNPKFSKNNNIDGSFNVIESARNYKKKIFFSSSAAIYGDTSKFPIDENNSKKVISPYGLEKKVIEEYLELYHKLYNFNYVAGRFFNVYGERQDPKSPYSGVISIFLQNQKDDKPITIHGDGSQSRDFIYVKDLVKAIYDLTLQKELNGSFNIATGNETTILELAKMITSEDNIIFTDSRKGDIYRSLSDISKIQKHITFEPKKICSQILEKI